MRSLTAVQAHTCSSAEPSTGDRAGPTSFLESN